MSAGRIDGSEPGERALDPVDNRREVDVAGERFAALVMQAADCGADLVVGVCRDILHQEIDEPGIALEDGQDLQCAVGRGSCHGNGSRPGAAARKPEGCSYVVGKTAFEENGEKTAEGEYQALQAVSNLSEYLGRHGRRLNSAIA